MQWTPEREQVLRKLWFEGYSGGAIAKELQVTRSAVLGKLHRAGLCKGTARKPEIRVVQRRSIAARIVAAGPKLRAAPMKPTPPSPQPSLNVRFLDRKPHQCVAITDATRFEQRCCGHPVATGSPYCAHHTALYSVPHKARGK